MTERELNRDVKRLGKAYMRGDYSTERPEYNYQSLIDEFIRLYIASEHGKRFNALSHRIMIGINRSRRIYPFHHYGELLTDIKEIN